MKVALCLVFCVGFALASADQWKWNENYDDISDSERHYGSEDQYEQSQFDRKQCKVGSRNLKTFDDEHKQIFLSTGFQVLSKDCSAYPTYAVLLRKLKPTSDLKIVKVATRRNNIVLIPSDEFDQEVKVVVNGRQRLINKNVEVVPSEGQYVKLIKIGSIVKVVLPSSKVVVEFDGQTCNVKVPRAFAQEHCGICNSNRYESSHLRASFDDLLFDDESSEHSRNLSPEDRPINWREESEISSEWNQRPVLRQQQHQSQRRNFCNVISGNDDYSNIDEENVLSNLDDEEEISRRFNPYKSSRLSQRRNFWESSDDSEILSTLKQQTVLKHKLIRSNDKICVSVQRVPQCPRNSYPQNEIQQHVSYQCVYPEKRLVQRFINEIRSGEPIFESSSIQQQVSRKSRVEVVPTECSPIY